MLYLGTKYNITGNDTHSGKLPSAQRSAWPAQHSTSLSDSPLYTLGWIANIDFTRITRELEATLLGFIGHVFVCFLPLKNQCGPV
jgi:hypothetical protein